MTQCTEAVNSMCGLAETLSLKVDSFADNLRLHNINNHIHIQIIRSDIKLAIQVN